MIPTERPLEPMKLYINVKLILPEDKGSFDDAERISLDLTQTLDAQFKAFLLKNSINLKKMIISFIY